MHGALLTTIAAALPQSGEGTFAVGDFWSLTQQAGPLRWPIFFVLALGLVQVFLKLWELVRDRRVSARLAGADLAAMSLKDITKLISAQDESMLATLQSTMVNVFQTRPSEGMLHDEISNFVTFEQDQFGSFRRRMEFLSDTAGALGLMGTVWGMFTVFFQGTAEQDVILRGMGIALITTLLGLVVSIILNFSTTEISSFHGKRLEAVSRKSDELRFRLMELAPKPAPAPAAPVQAATAPAPRVEPEPRAEPAPPPPQAAPAPEWHYVEPDGGPWHGTAGGQLKGLSVVVRNRAGAPAGDVPVAVSVLSEGGALDGGRVLRAESSDSGHVTFDCSLPERAGSWSLEASLPEQPGSACRFEIAVASAGPARLQVEGNNQAAVAGMKLPLPLGVTLFDRYENPVPGAVVAFSVEEGDGRFPSGNGAMKVSTGQDGRASAPFVVSSEAGQNTVKAAVEGTSHVARFIAFGTEV